MTRPKHKIDLSTAHGRRTAYRIVVSDRIEPTVSTDTGHGDRVMGNERAVMGVLANGQDGYRYDGRKLLIETNDLDELLISINDGQPHPAREYDEAREADFSSEFDGLGSGGSPGKSPSGGGSSDGGATNDASGDWNPDTGGSDRDLTPSHGIVDRPSVSARDRTIAVGKNGDVGTVQAALNRLPRNAEHEIRVEPQPGVHNNEPGDSLNTPPILVSSAYAGIKIVGDTDAPEEYVLDVKQANFQFLAGTAQNVALEGITVRGTIQNRYGALELDGCVVTTGERWDKGDNVPIDTYGGHVQILGGTVLKGEQAAFNFVENSSVSLSGDCVVDVGGPLCTTGQHGGELSFSGNTDVSCNGRLTERGWDQSLVVIKDPHGATDGLDTGSRGVVLGR